MSKKHLKQGDANPPINKDVPRIYSMQYCPYAERTLLVLEAKGVKYEVVNCNLAQKPEFLLERNPAGKVPVLEYQGNVIPESLIICDLLEDIFPEKPLTSKDPYQKARDKLVVDKISQMIILYYKTYWAPEDEKLRDEFKKSLTDIDTAIKSRNPAPFFGGEEPGMVDLMIWPWLERLPVTHDAALIDDLPNLKGYNDRLSKIPYVQKITISPEAMANFYQGYKKGSPVFDPE